MSNIDKDQKPHKIKLVELKKKISKDELKFAKVDYLDLTKRQMVGITVESLIRQGYLRISTEVEEEGVLFACRIYVVHPDDMKKGAEQ